MAEAAPACEAFEEAQGEGRVELSRDPSKRTGERRVSGLIVLLTHTSITRTLIDAFGLIR